jgi:hypothetical protein
MRVHWTTRDAQAPSVHWVRALHAHHAYADTPRQLTPLAAPQGPAPDALTHGASAGWTRSYGREDMCADGEYEARDGSGVRVRLPSHARRDGWLDPGSLHAATLSGLTPGARVFYTVGDAAAPAELAESSWSPVASFTAAPPLGTRVSLLAVADLGQAEPDGSNIDVDIDSLATRSYFSMLPSLQTAARMASDVASHAATLVVHNGDIAYGRGFGALWDVFFAQMAPVATRVPYMTSIGNHESNWPGHGDAFNVSNGDSGGECGVAYDARLPMPGAAPGAPWYSFDFGPIHFTQMSTEHAFAPGTAQYEFLAADLAAVNRSVTPWVIFSGHRPFYIDSINAEPVAGDTSVAKRLRTALEPLWLSTGVDVTLTGHHHTYQRTCAAAGGACVAACADGTLPAPVHIVAGHGGAGLSPLRPWRSALFVKALRQHGYLRIAADATSLEVTSVRASDGGVMDRVALRKAPGGDGRATCARHRLSLWAYPGVRVAAVVAAATAVALGVAGALWGAVLAAAAAKRRRRARAADVAAAPADGGGGDATAALGADEEARQVRRPLLP